MRTYQRQEHANGNRQVKMLNFLISTRDRIDRALSKFDKSSVSEKKAQGSKGTARKQYVPRMKNKYSLPEAILKTLSSKHPKTTDDVVSILKKRKLYNTKSDSFYTMVNIKLNSLAKDGYILRDKRGSFKAMSSENAPVLPKVKRGRPRKVADVSPAETSKDSSTVEQKN